MRTERKQRPILEIRDLCIDMVKGGRTVRVVDGVALAAHARETVALVGESGCGKTVTALSIARLLPRRPFERVQGTVAFGGGNLLTAPEPELRRIRGGRISYVFQDANAYLNPVMRIERQILEALQLHQPAKADREHVVELLAQVGIPMPAARARDYPHQLSGGMLQRVMIAIALAPEPELLIADEPTTALDMTLQRQILSLLRRLQSRYGTAVLLITHDLGVVREMADRVYVMYAGHVVEEGEVMEVLDHPRHPYTRALIRAVPKLGEGKRRLESIPGVVPLPGSWPLGCRFHPRCSMAREDCRRAEPGVSKTDRASTVRCWHWQDL